MRKVSLLCAVALLIGSAASASTIERLVQSERDFAALSDQADMRTAFLTFLADDGMVFGEQGATNGKKFWQGLPTPKSKLLWRPVHAGIAASGDLGFTTGPYENRREGTAPRYGWYASVWKLQPDGSWKVVCDLGASVKRPTVEPADWAGTSGRSSPPSKHEATATRDALLARERDLAARARDGGLRALYETIAAPDMVLLRDDAEPAVGREAALALQTNNNVVSWEPVAADMSSAGDFGYVYGQFKAGERHGSYMRVWRRDGDVWHVVLESSHGSAG